MTKERFAEIMRKGTIEDALKECYNEGYYAGVASVVVKKPQKVSVLSKLLRTQ